MINKVSADLTQQGLVREAQVRERGSDPDTATSAAARRLDEISYQLVEYKSVRDAGVHGFFEGIGDVLDVDLLGEGQFVFQYSVPLYEDVFESLSGDWRTLEQDLRRTIRRMLRTTLHQAHEDQGTLFDPDALEQPQ
jgi:hypothetical protein